MRERKGFTLVELLVTISIIALLASLLLPALGRVRETARRARCGKNANQIVIAQLNYATTQNQRSQSEAFVRGTEYFCQPGDVSMSGSIQLSDASRAFIYLAKRNYIDLEAGFACPSDPFVAPLDTPGTNIPDADRDFPTENTPAPAHWASPNAPARAEDGHTFYSYSMQAGSPNVLISPGPKMLATLPLITERNPWSNPVLTLTGNNPDDNGYVNGNSWNHNREGQTTAQRDGSNFFLGDAREYAITVNAAAGSAGSYDYLYSDAQVVFAASPSEVTVQGTVYTGVGTNPTKRSAISTWGCYMFD